LGIGWLPVVASSLLVQGELEVTIGSLEAVAYRIIRVFGARRQSKAEEVFDESAGCSLYATQITQNSLIYTNYNYQSKLSMKLLLPIPVNSLL